MLVCSICEDGSAQCIIINHFSFFYSLLYSQRCTDSFAERAPSTISRWPAIRRAQGTSLLAHSIETQSKASAEPIMIVCITLSARLFCMLRVMQLGRRILLPVLSGSLLRGARRNQQGRQLPATGRSHPLRHHHGARGLHDNVCARSLPAAGMDEGGCVIIIARKTMTNRLSREKVAPP